MRSHHFSKGVLGAVARERAPERLMAKSYRRSMRIADDKMEEGRQNNRRVQFKIVEKRVSLEEGR